MCWSMDPSGGNLKVIRAHVEVTSGTFGPIWDSFESSWRSSGDMWGTCRAMWGSRMGPERAMCSKPLVLQWFLKGHKRATDEPTSHEEDPRWFE